MSNRLPPVPSYFTGALADYLRLVVGRLNAEAPVSVFSGTSPESTISGMTGTLLINLGSASTSTRLWIKDGVYGGSSTTGWHAVRML